MRRLVALVVVLAAAGCGDDGAGTTTLKVGVVPIADVAPLYLGIDKGFFADEGLEIEPQPAGGGAAIVPSVVAGDLQFGFSNTTSLIIARSKETPIRIVAQGVLGGTGPEDAWDGVVVPRRSDIRTPHDLEGARVAVNTLNNVGPLTINAGLEDAGADPATVEYVELPFEEMNAALDAGRVDAAFEVEPTFSGAKAAGGQVVFHPFEATAKHLTVATYFTTEQYIAEHRGVVDRFVRAMERSLDYAAEHPDEVREEVGDYTEIPPEVLEAMTLPQWRADLNEPTIERTAKLAEEYGFVEQVPSLDELIMQR